MSLQVLIVDTNVVVAGLITAKRESPVSRILDGMLGGDLRFLLSPALLGEYRRVLLRERLTALHGLKPAEIDDILTELVANAIWHEPTGRRDSAPDPGDDHLWALLGEHPHSLLVTGDRLLLNNPLRDGCVLSPKACVERFLDSD